jgi:hypothetical protein
MNKHDEARIEDPKKKTVDGRRSAACLPRRPKANEKKPCPTQSKSKRRKNMRAQPKSN